MKEEIEKALEDIALVKEWYTEVAETDGGATNTEAIDLLDKLGVI